MCASKSNRIVQQTHKGYTQIYSRGNVKHAFSQKVSHPIIYIYVCILYNIQWCAIFSSTKSRNEGEIANAWYSWKNKTNKISSSISAKDVRNCCASLCRRAAARQRIPKQKRFHFSNLNIYLYISIHKGHMAASYIKWSKHQQWNDFGKKKRLCGGCVVVGKVTEVKKN